MQLKKSKPTPKPKASETFKFQAIGTSWIIDLINPSPRIKKKELLSKILERIESFSKTYSRFDSGSVLSKISRKSGEYIMPSDFRVMFDLYKKLYSLTEGVFTSVIGRTMEESGYDPEYSLRPKKLSRVPKLSDVIEYHEPILTAKKPHMMDFGAAGKGYLVDIVGEILKKEGVDSFCIDAGGDILYHSKNKAPQRIGLENPDNPEQVIGVANILNQSICGSAGNRRKWGNFHHIINPHTLKPVSDIIATWVIADKALVADGLTTCLFFVSPKILERDFKFEYFILKSDYDFEKSQQFPGEVFYNRVTT